MRKFGLFLLLALFLVSPIFAVSIEQTAVQEIIVPDFDVPAKFILNIKDVTQGNYNIYTLTDVSLVPTGNFYVEGAESLDVSVFARDSLDERGYYVFTYFLNNASNFNYQDKMTVQVLDLQDVFEIKSMDVNKETGKVSLSIKNNVAHNFGILKARFESVFFDSYEEFTIDSEQEKIIVLDANKGALSKTKAGVYVITATFETKNGPKEVVGSLYFGEQKGIAVEEKSEGFLINTKTVKKINTGNVDESVSVNMTKNIISRIFTTFNVEPAYIERRGIFVDYEWNDRLAPSEVLVVEARSNYVLPFLLVIFAALAIIFLGRYTETKVDVVKSVAPVKTKDGKFALKVRLKVKARRNIENVSIIDRIPRVVKVYKKFETMKPSKVDTENRRLQWNLEDMRAGEERVIDYIVYSKVGIVGKFSLPEAMCVFEDDGEIHEVNSNKVFFLSEQTRSDD